MKTVVIEKFPLFEKYKEKEKFFYGSGNAIYEANNACKGSGTS